MFFVEASGTHYEMGRQIGKGTRYLIGATVDFLTKRFRPWDNAQFERARERHMAHTEKRCPELLEELTGIADGSGFPFRLVYLTSFYATLGQEFQGCTNIIFTQTPDGPLLAKTNDLPVHEGKHAGVCLRRPKGRPAFLSCMWPGTIMGAPGVSETGLALGGSSCSANVPQPKAFMDPHAFIRTAMERAESVSDAIKLMQGFTLSTWGMNVALVDKSGDAAIVEKAGEIQGVRRAERGRLWCTNHPRSPELIPMTIQNPPVLTESVQRFEAVDRLSSGKPLTANLARELLSYDRQPGRMCRYGDDDPLDYETEFSCLLYPSQGRAEFCFTHAGRDPWRRFDIAHGECETPSSGREGGK